MTLPNWSADVWGVEARVVALLQGVADAVRDLPAPLQGLIEGVAKLCVSGLVLTVLVPLRGLYFYGPTLGGYGFWGGLGAPDMCAQLTHVSALDWMSSDAQVARCSALLERKFDAFAYTVLAVAYLWGLYKMVSQVWYRYAVLRPFAAEVRNALAVHRGVRCCAHSPRALRDVRLTPPQPHARRRMPSSPPHTPPHTHTHTHAPTHT